MKLLKKNDQLKNAYLAIVALLLLSVGILVITRIHFKRPKTNVKDLTRLTQGMQAAMKALEKSLEENTRIMKVVAHDLHNRSAR